MPRRSALLTAVLLAVLLAGCATGEDPDDTAAPPSPSAAASASPSAAASPFVASARVIDVRFAGGQVSGVEPRVPVTLGEKIVIRVRSDVAEQVHVHGYNLEQPVLAGGTVEIALTATISGGWDVEMHESGKTLFQLRVA